MKSGRPRLKRLRPFLALAVAVCMAPWGTPQVARAVASAPASAAAVGKDRLAHGAESRQETQESVKKVSPASQATARQEGPVAYRYPPNWRELKLYGAILALALLAAIWHAAGLPYLDRRFRRLSQEGMNALLSGRYTEAEKLLLAASRVVKFFGRKDRRAGASFNDLGLLYDFLGRRGNAEKCLRRALAIAESCLGPNHPDLAKPLQDYAGVLRRLDRSGEARRCEERAKAILAMPASEGQREK